VPHDHEIGCPPLIAVPVMHDSACFAAAVVFLPHVVLGALATGLLAQFHQLAQMLLVFHGRLWPVNFTGLSG
jgi:hypothetical protein